ncbi:oxidoreductase [Planctomycetales bacterium]|nr:oxidoreductase [Planctomycetales bacterium]
MFDVGIIGAGPAGTTLARLIGGRFSVLLIGDRRRKCCGGILSPEAQQMLAQFNTAIPKEILVNPQPFSVAVLDTATKIVRHYRRQYININRAAFDEWLLSLLPNTVVIRSPCRFQRLEQTSGQIPAAGHPQDKPLKIYFKDKQGREQSEQVRLLVGADGVFSAVRRFCSLHNEKYNTVLPKQYIALQDWFAAENIQASHPSIDFWNDYTGIFDKELTDFYAWTIPKDGVLLVGGAIPKQKNCRQHFERFKKKTAEFGLQLGKPFLCEAGAIFRPLSNGGIFTGTENIVLVGEAAGLISPSSAEGISFALASAFALSESFLPDGTFSMRLYRKKINPLLWKIRLRQFKVPAMFHPWLRKQIMHSGITALDTRYR